MRARAARTLRAKARLPLLERLEDRTVPSVLPLIPSVAVINISFTPAATHAEHVTQPDSLPPGQEKHLEKAFDVDQGKGKAADPAPAKLTARDDSTLTQARPAITLVAIFIDLTLADATTPAAADASLTGQSAAAATTSSTPLSSTAALFTTVSSTTASSTAESLTAASLAGTTPAQGSATTSANAAPSGVTTSFSAGLVVVAEGVAAGQPVLAVAASAVPPGVAVGPLGEAATQAAPATPARLSGGPSGQGDWLLEAPARPLPEKPADGAAPAEPAPGADAPKGPADPAGRDLVPALPGESAQRAAPADESGKEAPAPDVRPEGSAEEETASAADLGREESEGPAATADFFPAELTAAGAVGEEVLESLESLTAGEGRWWDYLGAMTLAATATASEVLRHKARLAEEEEAIDEETLVARLDRPGA